MKKRQEKGWGEKISNLSELCGFTTVSLFISPFSFSDEGDGGSGAGEEELFRMRVMTRKASKPGNKSSSCFPFTIFQARKGEEGLGNSGSLFGSL